MSDLIQWLEISRGVLGWWDRTNEVKFRMVEPDGRKFHLVDHFVAEFLPQKREVKRKRVHRRPSFFFFPSHSSIIAGHSRADLPPAVQPFVAGS